MGPIEIRENIYWVGVNDRTTDLFESVWPLPHGVSYNSYLINDDQVVLVDTVKGSFTGELLANIEEVIDPRRIDRVIVNHMEPDHSGALPLLLQLAPRAKVMGTEKSKNLLKGLYRIEGNFETVKEGQTLALGKRSLAFHEIPFVHWPETMATYLPEEKILFSGDAFGGFGALDGGIFDDQVDIRHYQTEILRYFSNIIGMYAAPTRKAIQKLSQLDIEVVAPTHGPIWREKPQEIIGLYDRWSRMEGEPGIALIFGSMYGNTELMVERVARGAVGAGVPTRVLDASRTHLSFLFTEAWRHKAIVLGSPTYDGGIFLPVERFLRLAQRKRLQSRIAGVFGSFGWSGGAVKAMKGFVEELKWELVEPAVEWTGRPSEGDLEQGEALGRAVAGRILKS